MKIISWNVNGFRAWNQKPGTIDFFNNDQQPDIFCLQETKAQPEQIDISLFPDYPYSYLHSAEKKGYSSTAIFSKTEPIKVWFGMDNSPIENEGRIINAEFENCIVITVYTPNAQHGLARLDYRLTWDRDFLAFVKDLEQTKPVIFCGDLNVAHQEIDLARPKANHKNPGFSPQERASFDHIVSANFTDSFRHFYPDTTEAYSWWSYRAGARARNVGWRIDYFCVSNRLTDSLKKAWIMPDVLGSDHCPVAIEIF
jgi:exodeoxyribonuclease-3